MNEAYRIAKPRDLPTPCVVVYPALVRANLKRILELARRPGKLRPHAKTHKTAELTRLELEAGIDKHKCATLAEAQLLAEAGARDILIAYPLVGPNIDRLAGLALQFPNVRWHALVDHPKPLAELQARFRHAQTAISLLVDLDVGMGRTGIALGKAASDLYAAISAPGVEAGGLHVYDGHVRHADLAERKAAVAEIWRLTSDFAKRLESRGCSVPRFVCGGTPTFPCWSEIAETDRRIECSPGTFFLNDASYFASFVDLPMPPAALVVGRVVSKPRPGRLTLDLGSKAVAPDQPLQSRVRLLNLPDASIVQQNEEHLVVDSPAADQMEPGDVVYGVPGHICPTCALHKELVAVEDGQIVGAWSVRARDRVL